jgi:hypothetical protein
MTLLQLSLSYYPRLLHLRSLLTASRKANP